MAPLIDVIFLVLVAFIEASVFTPPATVLPIRLPEAQTGTVQETDTVRLVVSRDGSVFYQDDPTSLAELTLLLVEQLQSNSKTGVSIVADERVDFGRFVAVMDAARSAGVTDLSVVAQEAPSSGGR